MLSIDLFQKDPKTFFDFYKDKLNCLNAKPNITHKYLKKLEDRGKLQAIITQNIDGLHQKAGSKNVYEMITERIIEQLERNIIPWNSRHNLSKSLYQMS